MEFPPIFNTQHLHNLPGTPRSDLSPCDLAEILGWNAIERIPKMNKLTQHKTRLNIESELPIFPLGLGSPFLPTTHLPPSLCMVAKRPRVILATHQSDTESHQEDFDVGQLSDNLFQVVLASVLGDGCRLRIEEHST
jgi:hypothetical protein